MVGKRGFEPPASCTPCRRANQATLLPAFDFWSGKEDLNLRPPAPETGALTRLRYSPCIFYTDHHGWSGREDLNLRPPAPKAGAITKLRYFPDNSVYNNHLTNIPFLFIFLHYFVSHSITQKVVT